MKLRKEDGYFVIDVGVDANLPEASRELKSLNELIEKQLHIDPSDFMRGFREIETGLSKFKRSLQNASLDKSFVDGMKKEIDGLSKYINEVFSKQPTKKIFPQSVNIEALVRDVGESVSSIINQYNNSASRALKERFLKLREIMAPSELTQLRKEFKSDPGASDLLTKISSAYSKLNAATEIINKLQLSRPKGDAGVDLLLKDKFYAEEEVKLARGTARGKITSMQRGNVETDYISLVESLDKTMESLIQRAKAYLAGRLKRLADLDADAFEKAGMLKPSREPSVRYKLTSSGEIIKSGVDLPDSLKKARRDTRAAFEESYNMSPVTYDVLGKIPSDKAKKLLDTKYGKSNKTLSELIDSFESQYSGARDRQTTAGFDSAVKFLDDVHNGITKIASILKNMTEGTRLSPKLNEKLNSLANDITTAQDLLGDKSRHLFTDASKSAATYTSGRRLSFSSIGGNELATSMSVFGADDKITPMAKQVLQAQLGRVSSMFSDIMKSPEAVNKMGALFPANLNDLMKYSPTGSTFKELESLIKLASTAESSIDAGKAVRTFISEINAAVQRLMELASTVNKVSTGSVTVGTLARQSGGSGGSGGPLGGGGNYQGPGMGQAAVEKWDAIVDKIKKARDIASDFNKVLRLIDADPTSFKALTGFDDSTMKSLVSNIRSVVGEQEQILGKEKSREIILGEITKRETAIKSLLEEQKVIKERLNTLDKTTDVGKALERSLIGRSDEINRMLGQETPKTKDSAEKLVQDQMVKLQERITLGATGVKILGDRLKELRMGPTTKETEALTAALKSQYREYERMSEGIDKTNAGFKKMGEGILGVIGTMKDMAKWQSVWYLSKATVFAAPQLVGMGVEYTKQLDEWYVKLLRWGATSGQVTDKMRADVSAVSMEIRKSLMDIPGKFDKASDAIQGLIGAGISTDVVKNLTKDMVAFTSAFPEVQMEKFGIALVGAFNVFKDDIKGATDDAGKFRIILEQLMRAQAESIIRPEHFTKVMQYMSEVGRVAGMTTEQVFALTTTIADTGITANNTSRLLASLVMQLSKSYTIAQFSKQLKIDLDETKPAFDNIVKMIEVLRSRFGTGHAVPTKYLTFMTDQLRIPKEEVKIILALVDRWDAFSKRVTTLKGSSGALEAVADVLRQSVTGQLQLLYNTMKEIGSAGNLSSVGLGAMVREGLDAARGALLALNPELVRSKVGLESLGTSGRIVYEAVFTLKTAFHDMWLVLKPMVTTIGGVVSAFLSIPGAVTAITSLSLVAFLSSIASKINLVSAATKAWAATSKSAAVSLSTDYASMIMQDMGGVVPSSRITPRAAQLARGMQVGGGAMMVGGGAAGVMGDKSGLSEGLMLGGAAMSAGSVIATIATNWGTIARHSLTLGPILGPISLGIAGIVTVLLKYKQAQEEAREATEKAITGVGLLNTELSKISTFGLRYAMLGGGSSGLVGNIRSAYQDVTDLYGGESSDIEKYIQGMISGKSDMKTTLIQAARGESTSQTDELPKNLLISKTIINDLLKLYATSEELRKRQGGVPEEPEAKKDIVKFPPGLSKQYQGQIARAQKEMIDITLAMTKQKYDEMKRVEDQYYEFGYSSAVSHYSKITKLLEEEYNKEYEATQSGFQKQKDAMIKDHEFRKEQINKQHEKEQGGKEVAQAEISNLDAAFKVEMQKAELQHQQHLQAISVNAEHKRLDNYRRYMDRKRALMEEEIRTSVQLSKIMLDKQIATEETLMELGSIGRKRSYTENKMSVKQYYEAEASDIEQTYNIAMKRASQERDKVWRENEQQLYRIGPGEMWTGEEESRVSAEEEIKARHNVAVADAEFAKQTEDAYNKRTTSIARKYEEMIDDIKTSFQLGGILETGAYVADKLKEKWGDMGAHMSNTMQAAAEGMTETLNQGFFDIIDGKIVDTEELLTNFVKNIAKTMISSINQMAVSGFMSYMFGEKGGGGGFLSGLFGGGRAGGGEVYSNKIYWVGEKGPELFSPSQNGTIIPNSSISGSNQPNINFQLNVENKSSQANVRARGAPSFDGRKFIQNIIIEDMAERGPIYRSMRGA